MHVYRYMRTERDNKTRTSKKPQQQHTQKNINGYRGLSRQKKNPGLSPLSRLSTQSCRQHVKRTHIYWHIFHSLQSFGRVSVSGNWCMHEVDLKHRSAYTQIEYSPNEEEASCTIHIAVEYPDQQFADFPWPRQNSPTFPGFQQFQSRNFRKVVTLMYSCNKQYCKSL